MKFFKYILDWVKEYFRTTPKRFFTSDLHINHKNVITYCNRPFSDVETMNKVIVKEWNKQVKPIDEVWFMGDFSFNPKWVKEITHKLNGRKYFIIGNHDSCFPEHRRHERMKEKYLEDGWLSVQLSKELVLKDGTKALLCHFPYRDGAGTEYDTRYLKYRPVDDGGLLIHGHLHCHYVKYNNMIDVGIDNDFKLVSEDELIAIKNDPRTFIPSRITEWYKTLQRKENMKGEGI